MIVRLIEEARAAGARLSKACGLLGLDPRTVQRWLKCPGDGDRRWGPKTEPPNKLSAQERRQILDLVNSPEYRDLSPNQIVPRLAEEGTYLASEATLYRILRQEDLLRHRESSKPRQSRAPRSHQATGPNQIWSWDITYLRSPVRGEFFYLYLVLDVWSRKIVGATVETSEDSDHAADLMQAICEREGIDPGTITLHSDNGGPMKGATLLATLEALGVAASYSRPRVSNDNAYSESLFRTLKYRPGYPRGGVFSSFEQAQAWVEDFTTWYNTEHRHSGIRYVTPEQRHRGLDIEILQRRDAVYQAAKQRHPERWGSRSTRDWSPIDVVELNPEKRDAA